MSKELEQDKYKGLGNGTWNEGYFPAAIEKPTELEQAAAEWSMDNQEGFCTHSMKIAAFKAGAEWQKKQFSDLLDKWMEHSIRGMEHGSSVYYQGKVALIIDLRDWLNKDKETPSE